jgi:heavy metal efflux system protein
MTASLAALGLVPAALSRGIGSETQRPLAVVIVAGTLSACALTLLLLPVMYRMWERLLERSRPTAGTRTTGEPAVGPI